MRTKYGFNFLEETIAADKTRLINQLWKVLPMRENNEDWEKQLDTVFYELIGLNEVFNHQVDFLVLFSKLESLRKINTFPFFRKTIFESINLLSELFNE